MLRRTSPTLKLTHSSLLLCGAIALLSGACRTPPASEPSGRPVPLTTKQLEFVRQVSKPAATPAEIRGVLDRTRWPFPGLYPVDLRRRAVAELVRRGQAMFMGVRYVVAEADLAETVQEELSAARIEAAALTPNDPVPSESALSARVRLRQVDYYVRGRCAIVDAAIVRRRDWTYRQRTLFALSGNEWRLIEILGR